MSVQVLVVMVVCAVLLAVGYTTYIRFGIPFLH
jgi:hypothetical protein